MSDEPPNTALYCETTVLADAWTRDLPEAQWIVERAVRAALAAVPESLRPAGGAEVSVVLADDATVRVLNRDYRDQDKATNVLSFAALDEATPAVPEAATMLGDIVLALETVQREAVEQGKALGDHLTHLVVHGLLHLLGYDHEDDGMAAAMEALEVRILAGLGIADPYAAEQATGGAA